MQIDNIFMIESGDLIQILEGGEWTNLGVISDKRMAAVALGRSEFKIMGKPVRVIRKS